NYLYHWSVRYRAGDRVSSEASLSTNTTSNSHPSAAQKQHSSGEEYSGKELDDDYYKQRINVYHLLRPIEELHSVTLRTSKGQTSRMSPVTKLIDTQVIDVRESGWLSFDIFAAIDRWVKQPAENFG